MSSKGLEVGVVAGGFIAAAVAFSLSAQAQEATQETVQTPPTGVSFEDPAINLSTHRSDGARFSGTSPVAGPESHQVELQVSASGDRAGVPVDVAFAHHGTIDAEDTGHDQRGSEVRVGHNLVQQSSSQHERGPSVYAFVASDDQALQWRPGQQESLALQDHQVEVGDHSAGVAYESHGVQTSLAYVQRKVSTRVGGRGYSTDESFAGVTVTIRH